VPETILLGGNAAQRRQATFAALEEYGELLSTHVSASWLALYQYDGQRVHSMPPLGVIKPYSVDKIPSILRVCREGELSVTARGQGSSPVGSAVPAQGGIVLLTHGLKQYRSDVSKLWVGAGWTADALNRRLDTEGRCFPYFEEDHGLASLGGLLSSGSLANSFYQGSPLSDWVKRVQIAREEGFDCVPAAELCAAEGRLGIVTELELTTCPIPVQRSSWSIEESLESCQKRAFAQDPRLGLQEAWWSSRGRARLWIAGQPWACAPWIERVGSEWEVDRTPGPWWRGFLRGRSSLCLECSLPVGRQVKAAALLERISADHGLDLLYRVSLLDCRWQICLRVDEELSSFRDRIQCFLEAWVNYLSESGGSLQGSKGQGALLAPFLPAFRDEASLRLLSAQVDPLYAPANHVPIPGRCVERRWNDGA
jgi:FAD/FMN-containing dehydrogenase